MAIDDATVAPLIALYPALGSIDDGERQQVLSTDAALVTAPAGVRLFEEGQPCRGFPLVLRGSVRVVRGSPEARQIELYRVKDSVMIRSWWMRLTGLSAIQLETSDRTMPQLGIPAIKGGTEMRELLRKQVELQRDKKRVREMDFDDAGDADFGD